MKKCERAYSVYSWRKFELIEVNERPVAMYRAEPRINPWWR